MMQKFSSNTTNRPRSRARARRAATAAGGLTLAVLAAAPLARADVTTPIISGLGWRSGSVDQGFPCLAALRGRALDVEHLYIAPPSFDQMVTNTGTWVRNYGRKAPLLIVSLALLPSNNKGQFAQCAAGAFDGSFRQIGANLKAVGAQGTVVRLGWEAAIGSGSHPWGVDTPDQVPAYKACWRHAALALKAGGPNLNVEWTNAKKTSNTALHVLDMYPGDDVVDLWGVHYYDSGPEKSTQALWDKYYNITYNGGPWGLGTWLAAAKAHGKKLAVGEYGIWRQGATTAAQADDPVYVDNMYRFFRGNAGSIAYETYFNTGGDHSLCPRTRFPQAAARYRADWGDG
jgi:hypothetical protein